MTRRVAYLWLILSSAQCLAPAAGRAQAPPLGPYGQSFMSQMAERVPTPWGNWYARGEFVYLERDRADAQVIAAQGGFSMGLPSLALTTNDLDFHFEPGARITVGRNFGPGERLEVSYLGFLDWSSTAAIEDPNGGIISTLIFAGGYDAARANYSSNLRSVEVNWRWLGSPERALRFSGLTGFRYLKIDEDFSVQLWRGDSLDEQFLISTENDLLGWQLGGDFALQITPRISVGGKGQGGIFLNLGQQDFMVDIDDGMGDGISLATRASDQDAAAVIETGLFTTIQVLPAVGLRLGYDVLFISGIALAPEQYGLEAIFGGELDDSGSTLFHGPNASVEVIW